MLILASYFLLGLKFQNRSDEAYCIDINFYFLSCMPFFIQRLQLKVGGATVFEGLTSCISLLSV